MADSSRVFYEPTAVAFTEVPTRLQHYFRQRSRWARGMFEGLRAIPPWRQKRWLSKFVASINLLIPLLDFGYVFIWLPGLLLFVVFQNPLFVSAWTLLVLPGTLLVYGGMRRYQVRRIFEPLGLKVRRNRFGYLAFLLLYQVISSTTSITGYFQYIFNRDRRWK